MTDQSSPPGQDHDYFSRRESQERTAADRSNDPAARRVHTALADGYAQRLRANMPVAG
ncbi:hypothetical protein [Sphingomonas sp.]|uniref:hypothetical protein n=1 Tax=Sphingomonas sp. TaxID=28214 RepID=UPI002E3495D1|nr:hypothetical protein [Sphingomonas sp.]HEX4695323.1 hypothetical protein [Sphingomonas sp.]